MAEPVIELEDISLAFGDHRVFDGLDLTIDRGETTVIVGRSGSGKTLLLKLMIGLIAPDRGRVRLFGRDLATISGNELLELRKRMGMLFQNYALFDSLSVENNVAFPLIESAHEPSREAHRRAHELLGVLDLAGSEDVLPGELSGGMKKRVSLARALVAHPEVVLFDEPTTGLDPIMVEKVDQMIALAKQKYGITSVVVSHDMASAHRLADRVVFLHDGKIRFSGSYDAFAHSEFPPILAFLDSGTMHGAREAPRADQPVIELIGVHKQFGDKLVLRGVDLAIYPRQITVVIGASGSGKSVIVKHIMGLMKPDRGEIRVFGKDIAAMRERDLEEVRTHLGLVFQNAALLDWLTVEQNVAFPLVQRRQESTHAIRDHVHDILERLGLTELRRRMPPEISAGERKRVALARAMITRPDILIYDEPTTGQDPLRTHEIDDMILQTQQQFDITTLVISHDMPSTFRIANTIAMIHEGKILAYGTPAEVAASSDAQVRHFLDAGAPA